MKQSRGFTLIQLVVTITIIGVLGSMTVPSFRSYVERARVSQAIGELGVIQIAIRRFRTQNGALPPTLADVNAAGAEDPWGNPYQYVVLGGLLAGKTDHAGDAINTDYDLFSAGPDGDTADSLLASESEDDVLRGNDGAFLGAVADYSRLP